MLRQGAGDPHRRLLLDRLLECDQTLSELDAQLPRMTWFGAIGGPL
jgi:hypothetical protein